MPQELHVVQCCTCEMFQVDILKKVPKWSCKMCGEKQSLKKVFGKGTGKECRLFVQELNQNKAHKDSTTTSQSIENAPLPQVQMSFSSAPSSNRLGNMQSKWSEFTTTNDNDEQDVSDMTFNHEKVETEADPKEFLLSSNQQTNGQSKLAKFGFDYGSKEETVKMMEVSKRTKLESELYPKESASSSIFEDNDIDAINFD